MSDDTADVSARSSRGRDLHPARATVDRASASAVVIRIRVAGDAARAGEALAAADRTR